MESYSISDELDVRKHFLSQASSLMEVQENVANDLKPLLANYKSIKHLSFMLVFVRL